MALTSRPNASEELPEEIAALVRGGIVRDVAISERMRSSRCRSGARGASRRAKPRRGVDVSGYAGD